MGVGAGSADRWLWPVLLPPLAAFHLHRGSPNRASKSALKLTLNCLPLFPTICSVLYGLVGGEDGCEA